MVRVGGGVGFLSPYALNGEDDQGSNNNSPSSNKTEDNGKV